MKTVTGMALLLALCSAGGSAYLLMERGRLAERVALLEDQAVATRATRAASESAVRREVEALVPQVSEQVLAEIAARAASPRPQGESSPAQATEESLAQGLMDLEQLALRVDTLETGSATLAPGTFQALLSSRLPGGETVEDFLDRRIAERRLGLGKGKGGDANDGKGDWSKHSFDELATALSLDEYQEQDVRRVIDTGKDRAFEIFNTTRPDGGNFIDDLADALMGAGDENADDVAGRVFIRALGEPFPGGNGTYGTHLFEAQGAVAGEIRGLLRDDQRDTYDQLSFDLFEVGTGHDPFQDRIMERMQGQEGSNR